MYLHIGEEVEIHIDKIIFCFDIKTIENIYDFNSINEYYEIIKISEDETKSIILVNDNENKSNGKNNSSKMFKLYLSPISVISLEKRLISKNLENLI